MIIFLLLTKGLIVMSYPKIAPDLNTLKTFVIGIWDDISIMYIYIYYVIYIYIICLFFSFRSNYAHKIATDYICLHESAHADVHTYVQTIHPCKTKNLSTCHTSLHTHIRTFHMSLHTYIPTYRTYLHIYIHLHTSTYLHDYIYIHTCLPSYLHVHTCMHKYIRVMVTWLGAADLLPQLTCTLWKEIVETRDRAIHGFCTCDGRPNENLNTAQLQ